MGEDKAKPTATSKGPGLFPILRSTAHGLSRMASSAELVDSGHLVEFRVIEARSILNRSISKRQLSLAYSINPYRGCEFGCRYCHARYTHEFLAPRAGSKIERSRPVEVSTFGLDDSASRVLDLSQPDAFERLIFIKKNAAWLLDQELRKIDRTNEIALGTATDPYQPIERRALVTRSLLEVFARKQGYRLGIVTKSALIERDIDLLQQIALKNTLVVHLTITTPDADLARLLEPRAPRPDLRFEAVRSLRKAGIPTGILCSPLLPGITDTEIAIDDMAQRAAEVGASFFAAQPLFLKPCSRPTYLSFVREHFPALEALYADRFNTADFAARPYQQRMEQIVTKACRTHGVPERSSDALLTRDTGSSRKEPGKETMPGTQQRLFA